MDAERAQCLADLAVLLVGHLAGSRAVAEMTAAVSIKLDATAIVAQHRLERSESRGGAFLEQEARVQDAAIGVI
jgi:hypothetical protein